MIQHVAVTGAAGFVGQAVVASLAEKGFCVRAIVRSGHANVLGSEQTIGAGNLLEAELEPLFAGCDAVVNCAARVHVLDKEAPQVAEAAYMKVNYELAIAMADAASRVGARRFVQLSSVAALTSTTTTNELVDDTTPPQPALPYGRSKLAADQALENMRSPAFSTVSLRPPAVYGPGVGAWFALLARAARVGVPLPIGRFENSRSFIFVGNLTDAIAAALAGDATGPLIVTDSPPISTADLYRKLLNLSGYNDRVLNAPRPLVAAGAKLVLGNRWSSFLGSAAYRGDRFSSLFNWRAPFPMDKGLALTMAHAR
ncbi:NAD-dependent epimerase/dehydratase family protein [Qipengyuania sp. DY56-A-20]|uniref:NAD-dependent epimerase/dehydratase family protein n=1 Tax=Qipengyuania benthica TaxID=3067651 RepID=A0ABT9HB80_9SPHN|nr:NAD-dependent epimerase/dehydratase family protein [Qipengyuania sp. DY56-A-20]MDP4540590.1 NAD-dependent epimerase/dehydratase family protein [Qipengyuania sp. DY56-A-20]